MCPLLINTTNKNKYHMSVFGKTGKAHPNNRKLKKINTSDNTKLMVIFAHAILEVSLGAVFNNTNSEPSFEMAVAEAVFELITRSNVIIMLKTSTKLLPNVLRFIPI